MNDYIKSEIDYLVSVGAIPSWHRNYYDDEGYQAYYYKTVHLSINFLICFFSMAFY